MTSHRKPSTTSPLLRIALVMAIAALALSATLTGQAATAQVAASDSVYASSEALTDTPMDVRVFMDETPPAAWDALTLAGYVGDPTDGCECFYVQPGTVVVGSDGWTWLFTHAGDVEWIAYPPVTA